MEGGDKMTTEEWAELERLCRKTLDTIPGSREQHEITEAVKLTGAFAASVQEHLRDVEDNKRDEDIAPKHP